EIQHRRVIEPNGSEVGTLKDLAVVPQGQFPAIQWAILGTGDGERVVKWTDVAQEIGHLRLRTRLETLPTVALPDEAMRLSRDLLDKQIVDTHGAKVVRVNDLQLSEVDGQLRLVGADVGLRGILRRVGAEGMAERAADILEEMAPDEAADLLQDLPEERREELVELMQKDEAEDVEELLTYPEDSAGGIMTTDFIALAAGLTAAQAIDKLRELQPDPELTYYLYVIDAQGGLDGVISLRDLVVARPETKLADVMDPHVLKVEATTSKEDVAALI